MNFGTGSGYPVPATIFFTNHYKILLAIIPWHIVCVCVRRTVHLEVKCTAVLDQ